MCDAAGVVDCAESSGSVELKRYPKSHPFAQLSGSDNIIAFTTQRYQQQPLIIRSVHFALLSIFLCFLHPTELCQLLTFTVHLLLPVCTRQVLVSPLQLPSAECVPVTAVYSVSYGAGGLVLVPKSQQEVFSVTCCGLLHTWALLRRPVSSPLRLWSRCCYRDCFCLQNDAACAFYKV